MLLSLQHILKAKDTRFDDYMLLNFEAGAKSLRPRPKDPKAEDEARGQNVGLDASLSSRL